MLERWLPELKSLRSTVSVWRTTCIHSRTHGRRFGIADVPNSLRSRGRPHVLGELHAADAAPPLLTRGRRLVRTHTRGGAMAGSRPCDTLRGRVAATWSASIAVSTWIRSFQTSRTATAWGGSTKNDEEKDWQEPGNSVIVCPKRGDSRWAEQARRNHPVPELDLAAVHSARRMFDPVGHYH